MHQLRLILLLIFAALNIMVFNSCENSEEEINEINRKQLGIEVAKEININFTKGGKIKAILTAPLMLKEATDTPYIEFPNSIHVDFYNEKEQKESTLDAKYARYRENQKVVFLRDSVRVINLLKGDTLFCKELYWDRNRIGNEFYTDKPVRIRSKTIQQDGTGMDASQDFKNWHITYPRGTIASQSGQFQ